MIIEGYYSLTDGLMDNPGSLPSGGCLFQSFVPGALPSDVDTVFISAVNPVTFAIVDRKWGILQADGLIQIKFSSNVIPGSQYYLKINQRNTIETWSTLVTMMSPVTAYDFTDGSGSSEAWFNMREVVPGIWAIYSGDIADDNGTPGTQNGYIDVSDFLPMDLQVQAGVSGYYASDLDGDGFVTISDFVILDPNIQAGRGMITPP
jgi:hypothetical protein